MYRGGDHKRAGPPVASMMVKRVCNTSSGESFCIKHSHAHMCMRTHRNTHARTCMHTLLQLVAASCKGDHEHASSSLDPRVHACKYYS